MDWLIWIQLLKSNLHLFLETPISVRRGCSAADLFLATCYSYFSINLTKRRIFSVSCQRHLFINGLIASISLIPERYIFIF
jgi:hypothetical protein